MENLRKIKFVSVIVALLMVFSILSVCLLCGNYFSKSNVKFEKVDIKQTGTAINSFSSREAYDLETIITGNGSVNALGFSGEIVDIEEYEVSWVNNGENWGPYSRTILTVELNKIYYGEIKSELAQIKILYPNSTAQIFDESVKIGLGKEYIFVNCWILDDQYEAYAKNSETEFYKYDKSLKYADVIMGGAWNSLLPIENGSVIVYHEFLKNVDNCNALIQSYDLNNAKRLTNVDSLKNGKFVSVKSTEFEKIFLEIIEKYISKGK